jgi:hypothetical protein
VVAMVLMIPRVPPTLFAVSFAFPVYYTALSIALHVRRPLGNQPS